MRAGVCASLRASLRACVFACVIPSFVLRSLFVPTFLALLPFLLVDQIQENIFVLGKRAEHMAVVQRLEVAFSPSSRTGKNMEAGCKNEEAYHVRTILDFNANSPRNKKPRSTTFPEAEKRGGNTTLGRVFSLIFEVFGKVVKHGIACFDISSQSRLKPRRNG